jgi:hypothetical protein
VKQAARIHVSLLQSRWQTNGKLDRLQELDPEMFDLLERVAELYGDKALTSGERELAGQYDGALQGTGSVA